MRQTRLTSLFTLLVVMFLTDGVAWADGSRATLDTGVKAFFTGSSELPDEIAFGEFLKIVDATYDAADLRDQGIVAAALGFDLETQSNHARARAGTAFFRNAYRSMRKEQIAAKISVLCTSNRATRNDDQVFDAMNAVDDIGQAVMAKHYLITMNSLPANEQQAFAKFLNEMKAGISYARIDSRYAESSSQEDIRVTADRTCNQYKRDQQKPGEMQP